MEWQRVNLASCLAPVKDAVTREARDLLAGGLARVLPEERIQKGWSFALGEEVRLTPEAERTPEGVQTNRLVLTLDLVVRYREVQGTLPVRASRTCPGDPGLAQNGEYVLRWDGVDHLPADYFSALLPELCQGAVQEALRQIGTLPERLPSEAAARRWLEEVTCLPDGEGLTYRDRFARDLRELVYLRQGDLTAPVLAAVQTGLAARRAGERPEDAVGPDQVSLTLRAELRPDLTALLTLSAGTDYPGIGFFETALTAQTRPLETEAFQGMAASAPAILEELGGLVPDLAARLGARIPVWVTGAYRYVPEFLARQAYWQEGSPNGIQGLFPEEELPEPPLYLCWDEPPRALSPTAWDLERGRDLHWKEYLTALREPYDGQARRLPENVHEFAAFLNLADRVYGDLVFRNVSQKPRICFALDGAGAVTCTWARGRVPLELEQGGRTVAAWLKDLLTGLMMQTLRYQRETERCREAVLQLDLSLAERAVLEYLRTRGRTWFSDLAGNLPAAPRFTRDALGRALDRLSQSSMPLESGPEPLLLTQKQNARHRGTWVPYTLYTLNGHIPIEALEDLSPAQVRPRDVGDIVPAQREAVCRACAVRAQGEEELRQVLEQWESLPRTARVRFAQSLEGMAFFHRFRGEGRRYIRRSVADLPGCRDLADQLAEDPPETETLPAGQGV